MTTSLGEFIEAVAGLVETLDPELQCRTHPPSHVDGWMAFIVPPEIDYRLAMRAGGFGFDFEVVFLVPGVDADNQVDLWPFVDPTGDRSLRVLLDANRTLGFDDVDCVAMRARPLGLEEIGLYEAWGYAVLCQAAITNNQG